jgi:hypothetical protein
MNLHQGVPAVSRSTVILLSAVLALAALVGCSGDDIMSPNADDGRSKFSGVKAIGPSRIILCFDVSDTVSDAELQAVVDAVGAGLSNADLVPQDGSIGISAMVYADTIGAVFDTLIAVTPEALENVIVPALQGLVADRLVGGPGADLAGALDEAQLVLASSGIMDRHVLIMGSGAASDAAAVEDACQALAADGIMVSAVGYGGADDPSLLMSCADATGGFFGDGTEDLQGTTDLALAYMLQVDMITTPVVAELMRGAEHRVGAKIFRAGAPEIFPLQGLDVEFEILEGPQAGAMATAATDTYGMATFVYLGEGGPGIDKIVARGVHPGTGEALIDTVFATWLNFPPTCDAGGPYELVVEADTVMVTLDASASADADGDTLTFAWSISSEGASLDDASAMNPVLTLTGAALCADSLMVDLVVSDGFDNSQCAAVVVLDDMRAPVVEVSDVPVELWPANHKYVSVTPEMFVEDITDACDRPIDLDGVEVVMVRSDEPEDHKGDGRTIQDIVIHCDGGVELRAERMGGSNGRVYEITYRITGENGVSTDFTGMAVVPHDQSGSTAVDDGDAGYTVEADCDEDKPRD